MTLVSEQHNLLHKWALTFMHWIFATAQDSKDPGIVGLIHEQDKCEIWHAWLRLKNLEHQTVSFNCIDTCVKWITHVCNSVTNSSSMTPVATKKQLTEFAYLAKAHWEETLRTERTAVAEANHRNALACLAAAGGLRSGQ